MAGRLERPFLAIRAIFDPMIVAYPSDRYADIVQLAGCDKLFAQQYVREVGHDQFRPEQIRSAFNELRRWRSTGERPAPGAVPESSTELLGLGRWRLLDSRPWRGSSN